MNNKQRLITPHHIHTECSQTLLHATKNNNRRQQQKTIKTCKRMIDANNMISYE